MNGLDERWCFYFMCGFLPFPSSNAPITQCHRRSWRSFLFSGSLRKLYRSYPKKLMTWLPAKYWVFERLVQLSPIARRSADCRFYSGTGAFMSRPLSSTDTRNPVYYKKTVTDITLNRRSDVAFVKSYKYFHLICSSSQQTQFSSLSSFTIIKDYIIFSRITASFGIPNHSTSCVSVHLLLKSMYHRHTVVFVGAESV